MAYYEWYTREYICANGVCEKTKYPVRVDGDRSLHTSREYRRQIRRAEKNATEAKTEAARSANDNFRVGVDYLLTATLSPEGLETLTQRAGGCEPDALKDQMRKEYQNWIRRAKRRMPEGSFIKAMAWVCDLDGKTGEMVLPHIHVIVNREGMEAFASTWKLGYVFGEGKTLYSKHHGDLTDLVEYLMDQARVTGTEKRYIPTRNLTKPQATTPRLARNPDARLRVPKGASLICASEQRAGRPQKIRYYRPEKDRGRDPVMPSGETAPAHNADGGGTSFAGTGSPSDGEGDGIR